MATKVRVVGSGYTTLHFAGSSTPIAFLDSFTDSGQKATGGDGQGWEAITTLGDSYPIEIATSRVLGAGTITANIRELWNEPVWRGLAGLANAANIVDVWRILDAQAGELTCFMRINPPGTIRARTKTYHNCVVTSIDDGEDVSIGTLSVSRKVEIVYTHAELA